MTQSLHLVHHALRGLAENFPHFENGGDLMLAMRQGSALQLPDCDDEAIEWHEQFIVRPADPPLRIILYRPRNVTDPIPVVLHIHGGGLIAGRPEIAHDANAALCEELRVAVVSVNYRLAPEFPFPAALNDCDTALQWIHEQAEKEAFDRSRVAVKGESAGGGLAAILAQLTRDRGDCPIAFQCLTYPMLDDRPPCDANPFAGEFIWTEAYNRYAWNCYLGDKAGTDVAPRYAAAARCDDLGRLPPTAIFTGALDLFFEQNLQFAGRLVRAGVPVEFIAYPGVIHGFERAGETAIKDRYRANVRSALREALFAAD